MARLIEPSPLLFGGREQQRKKKLEKQREREERFQLIQREGTPAERRYAELQAERPSFEGGVRGYARGVLELPLKRKRAEAAVQAEDIVGQGREEFQRGLQEARDAFQTQQHLIQGGQIEAARQQQMRDAARAGILGSGLGQAQVGLVTASGLAQQAATLAQFDMMLAQAEIEWGSRATAFLRSIFTMGLQHDFDMELARFQAQMAADQASAGLWGNLFQAGAFLIGGPIAGIGTTAAVQGYGAAQAATAPSLYSGFKRGLAGL